MGFNNNERDSRVTPIYIGTLATSANSVVPGLYFPKRSRIKNVWYVDQAATAKNASNHLVLTLQDNAGSPVAYATADTTDNAVVALTPYALAYTNDSGDSNAGQKEKDVPAGTMLNFKVVGAGTAVSTLAIALVEWYPL